MFIFRITRAGLMFAASALLILIMLFVSVIIPAKVFWGIPYMLWFWLGGILVFWGMLAVGVKWRDK